MSGPRAEVNAKIKNKDQHVKVLRMPFADHIPEEQWPKVLDWSYSNMLTLFDIGYETGKKFAEDNAAKLAKSQEWHMRPREIVAFLEEHGLYETFMTTLGIQLRPLKKIGF